jgi:hypothetical protein
MSLFDKLEIKKTSVWQNILLEKRTGKKEMKFVVQ